MKWIWNNSKPVTANMQGIKWPSSCYDDETDWDELQDYIDQTDGRNK